MQKQKNPGKKNRGYTLLFAVLVSALVLAVGVSILNIARKELILSSNARESQYAFYSADTGYECSIYWDSQGFFSTTTFLTLSPAEKIVSCGTDSTGTLPASSTFIMSAAGGLSDKQYTFTFTIPLATISPSSLGQACAYVTLTKDINATGDIVTTVTSDGYNVGWVSTDVAKAEGNCDGSNQTKVQRTLYASY